MITSKQAEAITAEAAGSEAHQQVMRLAVNAVAEAHGLTPPWPVDLDQTVAHRIGKLIRDLGNLGAWGVAELGDLREKLLTSQDRSASGSWYTPPQIARPLTRAAVGTVTDLSLDDDPDLVLNLSVLDPACGGGAFLVAAARELASLHVSLLFGTQTPADLTIRAVLPNVMRACVYGIDTDPVAVDLAKSACWLEANGAVPIDWLDDNIVVGNALHGDLPPALAARLNTTGPLVIVGNPPYKDKAKGAAPWIEARRPGPGKPRADDELYRPSLDEFRYPGNGRLEYGLSNLHVFFWRWALWRTFETRLGAGAVVFLSPSGWLAGRGFAGMRSALRRAADYGWIIDLAPEGMRADVRTRIFPGVAQPVCAAIFTRVAGPRPHQMARVQWAKATGTREEKAEQIERLLAPHSAGPHRARAA